jgi:selenocysteine-specific elongation factor
VKISGELYFDRAHFETARGRLLDYLANHGEINAATYRDLLAGSRKFAISLLDYFDHAGVTTRIGDVRRLRKAPDAAPR